jgi:hypothetical protein
VMIVGTLAAGSTFFSLATGWMICCGVPERTGTRPLIRGAAGCPLLMMGLIVLIFLMRAFFVPEPPSRAPLGKIPASRDEMQRELQRLDAEYLEKHDAYEEKVKTFGHVMKVITWVEMLAFVGGYATFGFFLGVLGDYLGEGHLRFMSYALVGLDGAVAAWFSLAQFAVTITSPTLNKVILVLLSLAAVATYGCLTYMAFRVQQAIKY